MGVAKRSTPMSKEVFTAKELATMINVNEGTLARWRETGRGPRHFRLDARSLRSPVRYHRDDIAEWVNEQKAITAALAGDDPPVFARRPPMRSSLEGIARMRPDGIAGGESGVE